MADRRILLVSYLLPPAGGVGVQRPLSLLRYLPELGCRVTALTVRNPVTGVYDPALLERIPRETEVLRTWTFEPPHWLRDRLWRKLKRGSSRDVGSESTQRGIVTRARGWLSQQLERMAIPDPQRAWRPLATRRAMRLVRSGAIDTVIVSVPPFSSLQIGVRLKRRFPHLTLISDFRDEWIGWYLAELDPPPSPERVAVSQWEERAAIEASDYVVIVTPAWRDTLRRRYPDQPDGKFICVTNGYEPTAFGGFQSQFQAGDKLQVVYAGTVYRLSLYSPLRWLEPLDALEESVRSRINTRLVGRIEPNVAEMLAQLQGSFETLGFLPHAQAVRHMADADVLLLIAGNSAHLPGKLFEYLASGKPVVALTPPGGEVAKILDRTQAGFWADIDNPEAIRALARRLIAWKQNGAPFQPDWEAISSFSRPALVQDFARKTGLIR